MKGRRVTKNVKEIKFQGVWVSLNKKKFPETTTHKIFETNSSFHMKWRTTGKSLISVFKGFFPTVNKTSVLPGRLGTRLSFYDA